MLTQGKESACIREAAPVPVHAVLGTVVRASLGERSHLTAALLKDQHVWKSRDQHPTHTAMNALVHSRCLERASASYLYGVEKLIAQTGVLRVATNVSGSAGPTP